MRKYVIFNINYIRDISVEQKYAIIMLGRAHDTVARTDIAFENFKRDFRNWLSGLKKK